ncbi:uncharacterized protein LOC123671632 [Harmonia axyridis]|uniref:uncharacterized protein LOC123671632 n=1 Tax=Harmonia axyridis TaxID=115357 RepID=UPI001E2766AE|nr:uncharacterized protein LOC123671632 [Harmonia axyridis]
MRWEDDIRASASPCSTLSLGNEGVPTSCIGGTGKSPVPSSFTSFSTDDGGRKDSISRNAEFESVVLSTLSKISTCIDQHSIILAEMNRRASLAGSENLNPPESIMSHSFPFQTLSSFQEFENKLTDKMVWDYMMRRLASLGGSGTVSLTRRMLRYILSDNVAKLFNWKGRDKIAFENYRTKELLLEAVKITFPAKEIDEYRICTVMKEWLKFASARLKKTSRDSK